jgi:hypothetical protein
MPAHLHKRRGRGTWEIVEGRHRTSTHTGDQAIAKDLLEKYVRDRFGVQKLPKLNRAAKACLKEFGQHDLFFTMRRLRFPCVYAFVRDGEIIYVGSSVNGLARALERGHPMATPQTFSITDSLFFWITHSVGEAREMELAMIRKGTIYLTTCKIS